MDELKLFRFAILLKVDFHFAYLCFFSKGNAIQYSKRLIAGRSYSHIEQRLQIAKAWNSLQYFTYHLKPNAVHLRA